MKKKLIDRLSTTLLLCVFLLSPTVQSAELARIISTDAGSTELIISLGLQDKLIAIDVTSTQPDTEKPLPSIGYHRNLSAEGLMSLNPDAIIGSNHMGPDHVVEQIKRSQINLIQLPVAHTVDQLSRNIRSLAQRLNITQLGDTLVAQSNKVFQTLQEQALSHDRAVFLLSMDGKLRMAGKKTGGGALVSLLGAKNLADYDNYRSISAEALVALQPSIILVSNRDPESGVQTLLDSHPLLKHTPAGKSGKILTVDGRTIVSGGLSISALAEAHRLSDLLHKDSTLAQSSDLKTAQRLQE